jgi:hypothetical protein
MSIPSHTDIIALPVQYDGGNRHLRRVDRLRGPAHLSFREPHVGFRPGRQTFPYCDGERPILEFFSAVVLSALAVVPLGQYAAILQRGRVKEPYAMTIFRAIFLLQLLTPALNYAGTILLGVAVYVVAGNDIQRAAFYCFIAISGSALLFGTYVTSWTKLFIVSHRSCRTRILFGY